MEGLTEKLHCISEFTNETYVEIKNYNKLPSMYREFLIWKISAIANWACKILPNRKLNSGAYYFHQMKTKYKLVDFIVQQWISNSSLIGDKILIVTKNTEACNITSNSCILFPELESNHEEADSQMMLHVKHASRTYSSLVMHTPEADVFMIVLSKIMEFDCQLY